MTHTAVKGSAVALLPNQDKVVLRENLNLQIYFLWLIHRVPQIFQLLLPEAKDDSHTPLILLGVLCFIAPLWAWGASLVTTVHPERQRTLPR